MLSNIFGSPRTTLAGLWGVIGAAIGSQIVPAAAAYLGAQTGIGWQLAGMLLGLVVPLLMPDKKAPAPAP